MHSVVVSMLRFREDIFTRLSGLFVQYCRHNDEITGDLTWMIWIKL